VADHVILLRRVGADAVEISSGNPGREGQAKERIELWRLFGSPGTACQAVPGEDAAVEHFVVGAKEFCRLLESEAAVPHQGLVTSC